MAVEGADDLPTWKPHIKLSMNSVVGLNELGTIKLRGYIGTQIVMVPIDCGATHNFLAQDLVDEFQLLISLTGD